MSTFDEYAVFHFQSFFLELRLQGPTNWISDHHWHSFLECPLIRSQRRECILLTKLDTFFERDSSVENRRRRMFSFFDFRSSFSRSSDFIEASRVKFRIEILSESSPGLANHTSGFGIHSTRLFSFFFMLRVY